MDKKFWGPATWCIIHTSAYEYTPEKRLSFKQFVYSLPYLLPCDKCCVHLYKNLNTLQLGDKNLQDSQSLFIWTYFLHDLVNRQLGKKSPNFPSVYKFYTENKIIWKKCFWRTIHSFAASYRVKPEVKSAFKQFIYSLIGLIPQPESMQYATALNRVPLTDEYLKDAHNLFLWSYLIHDLVNKETGKSSPPFEEIKKMYFNDTVCQSCGTI